MLPSDWLDVSCGLPAPPICIQTECERLQCLGKSSNGSQKQLAVEVTSAQAETHKVNGRMGKKTVTDKPCRSLPARTLPCSVQVSGKETQKPKSPSRGVLNTEACSPKESINIKPRGEEPAESTAAPDEELKMKDSSNTWPSDSAGIGGRTHAPPPVEPVSMHEPNEEEEQTKEDDAEDEDLKAPVELKIEFLGALMDKDFQLAHKLCQMILIHEPDNPEASEFLPLIHKKLLEEQEAEQSNEEDDEEEDSDDDDGNSGSDEESSQSSSCSSSSRSSSSPSDDDAEKEEAQVNRHKPCPPSHICP
ncbi:rRNA-processing protein EFG1-like [Seriola lalandi dorsalis]|uniref:rRNA-processing protein EFG1-like n=1 Tax=Seriola lalandi dorsalis TaxID=1841481 RepID=UPI000C6F5506|nr:rRNA-processing protein EFG1-like [Seriola lalandi dorsalis]